MTLSQEEALPQPMHIKILSSTPGRIRLRVLSQQREPEMFAQIANILTGFFPQIHNVRTNFSAGSITVYYNGEIGDFDGILKNLESFGITVGDLPVKKTQGATVIANVFAYLNQQVEQITNGSVDLRLLFPLLLALLALRQLIAKEGPALKTSPWYILAWYAFDSFLKLNQSKEVVHQTSNGKYSPNTH